MAIDPKLFTVDGVLNALLYGARFQEPALLWRYRVEIVPDYVRPYDEEKKKKLCVVRFKHADGEYSYLRYSKGPAQGHFWDVYGDDYFNPMHALVAILQAPTPPGATSPAIWKLVEEELNRGE